MTSPLAAALAAFTALASPETRAEPPRAEGRIESAEGRVEILGRPYKVGETIELPEGFMRVEEAGPEDGQIGSFSVVATRDTPPDRAEQAPEEPPRGAVATAAAPPQAAAPRAPDCRRQRGAYLAELMRLSGIEISSPAALVEGLDAGGGQDLGFYWFALQTDPFRPLAWSSELRARAEALTRCVRGG